MHRNIRPWQVWQVCLKKTKVELEFLTDNDVLLMFEEGIRGEYAKQHIDMPKPIINTWIIMI